MSSGEAPGFAAFADGDAGTGAPWIETAKVKGPTCTRSRSFSVYDPVSALPLTSVPLRLPRSRTDTLSGVTENSACSRLTSSLFGRRWQSSPRPIRKFGMVSGMTFPSGLPWTTMS